MADAWTIILIRPLSSGGFTIKSLEKKARSKNARVIFLFTESPKQRKWKLTKKFAC